MRLRSASINGGKPTRWSKSGHAAGLGHVPFTPKSDRLLRCREMTLCAISDRSALQQNYALFDNLVGGPWGRP